MPDITKIKNLFIVCLKSFLLAASWLEAVAQPKPILIFDLETGNLNSITNIPYDTMVQFTRTNYYLGRQLLNQQVNRSDLEIDIRQLPEDIYFILITIDKSRISRKLVIQRNY